MHRLRRHAFLSATFAGALLAVSLVVHAQQGTAAGPTFVDPTARLTNRENIRLGELVFIAPFARLLADDDGRITIGNESNVQDNVLIDARRREGAIRLGEKVILAHGSAVVGPARLGEAGTCPVGAANCPSFVGFNAVGDGAIIEKDAMVLHLARVAPGVRIPSGRKVLPGAFVRNQGEVTSKTAPMVDADREFMRGVIEVNVEFARGYTELSAENPTHVRGINYNPQTPFNDRDLPTLGGVSTRNPSFRNRIIGDVRTADSFATLSAKMGDRVSLRADEGDPFQIGTVRSGPGGPGMGDRHVLHALEHTQMTLGNDGRYGYHSLIHGGPADFNPTATGVNFTLGDYGVFFRSSAGTNVTVGAMSLVQQASLPDNTTIPPCTIRLGTTTSTVEWCNVAFPRGEGDGN